MRMRRRNNLAPRMAACEPVWIHEPETLRGNWRSLMPGCRELRVEVGCGKGKFTVETAAAEPDVLLIAIEKVPDALVLAMESAMKMGLKNVFFVSLDADRIDEFFADDEIDLLYINFCEMESCYLELCNLTRDLHANGPVGIMTGYEEKFYALGTPINRVEAVVVTKTPRPADVKDEGEDNDTPTDDGKEQES